MIEKAESLTDESQYYPAMKKIYNGDYSSKNYEGQSMLLYNGVIFEYNGECWIDLHPLVRQYIDNNPEVLD